MKKVIIKFILSVSLIVFTSSCAWPGAVILLLSGSSKKSGGMLLPLGGGSPAAADSGTGTTPTTPTGPTFSVNSPSGAENSGAITVTITLSAAQTTDVTVDYATSDGTAKTSDSDYTSATGTLTFTAGQTTKTFDVTPTGDSKDEDNETVTITLSNPSTGISVGGTGTVTITNDDTAPSLSIENISSTEGSTQGFTVTLTVVSGKTVTVAYTTSGLTAVAGSDYTAESGTLTFAPGETSKTISVTTGNDSIYEDNETYTVDLSGATNATISVANGVGTITNNDTAPTVTVSGNSQNEGTILTYTVSLSAVSGKSVTFDYTTNNTGTATTTDSDFTAASATGITIAAGSTSATFTVTTTSDTKYELNETVGVALSNITNSSNAGGTATGSGTIVNDDSIPTLSVTGGSGNEGNTGTSNATFGFTLSNPTYQNVVVTYNTADSTAYAVDSDYVTVTGGSATITAGNTTQSVNISVNGDTKDEPNESFALNISATNTSNGTASGVWTINNDDTAPTISINSPSVAEGNSGTTILTFTVSLSSASSNTITVNYATANGITNPATAGTDYTTASGTLTFNPDDTSKTINVSIAGDTLNEIDETLTVTLSTPTNATIATATGTGTITNEDAIPSLSINDVTQAEGNSGTSTMTFTVTLSAASGQAVTVDYATANGTATTADSDYVATNGTLTFNPGDTTKIVAVTINGDATSGEVNETFTVGLSNVSATATIIDNSGTGTINDDDSVPSIEFTTTSQSSAGESGTMTITVQATGIVPGGGISVPFTVTGTAANPADYTITASPVTVPAGTNTSATITITIASDTIDENNETVIVTMGSLAGAVQGTNTVHTATITDDDDLPTVSLNIATASSSNESGTLTITADLTASGIPTTSGLDVTVPFTLAGTATLTSDYTITSSPITIPAGSSSANIVITIVGDSIREGNETVQVNMTTGSVVNATPGTASQTATITDDEIGVFSAKTIDCDADGYLDHYEIVFTNTVNDSTFPGYAGANSEGATTSEWLISGRSGVRIVTGTALVCSGYSDTANDLTIFIKYTEGASPDTGAKPDITTTANLGLLGATAGFSVAQLYTSSATEADTALPVIMTATGLAGSTSLTVTFSEAVYGITGAPACGSGGEIVPANDLVYTNGSAGNAASISSISDNCATGDNNIILTVNANFADPADDADTIAMAAAQVYDAANNAGQNTVKNLNISTPADATPPTVVSAGVNTGGTGVNDIITVVMTETVNPGTTADWKVVTGLLGTCIDQTNYNNATSLNISSVSVSGSTVTITLNGDLINTATPTTYTVVANPGVVKDTSNNLVGCPDAASFISNDTARPVVNSAYIDAVTKTVHVTLSENVQTSLITNWKIADSTTLGTGTCSGGDLYSLAGQTGDYSISSISTSGNIVSIVVSGTITAKNYTVIADPTVVKDLAGNLVSCPNNAVFAGVDTTPPTVLSAYTDISCTGCSTNPEVVITMSETVDAATANTAGNWKIADSTTLGSGTCAAGTLFNGASQTSDFAISSSSTTGNIVRLKLSTITKTVTYTVIANPTATTGIKDGAGNAVGCPNFTAFPGADTVKPYMLSTISNTVNTITVNFSEPMKTGTYDSKDATMPGNYTISPAVSVSSVTQLTPNRYRLNLGGNLTTGTIYTVTTATTVTDVAGNTIGTPNTASFKAGEQLYVVAARALSTTSIELTFNKDVLPTSANCSTTTACNVLYKLNDSTLGDITSATVQVNAFLIIVNHSNPQTGSAYTIAVANADGAVDNFPNGTTSLRNLANTENVQAEPKDRASFIGLGSPITDISGGSFFVDPYFDGTVFSFAFDYDGKVFLGTNDNNDSAFRFDPNGSNTAQISFSFASTANCYTFGVLAGTINCVNLGPNGERGVVGFNSGKTSYNYASGPKAGQPIELLIAGPYRDILQDGYYTQDLDISLEFKNFGLANLAGGNTKSLTLGEVYGQYLYTGVASNKAGNKPIFNRHAITNSSDVLTVANGTGLDGNSIEWLGDKSNNTNKNTAETAGIDSLTVFDRTPYTKIMYLANNGGVAYTSTYEGTPAWTVIPHTSFQTTNGGLLDSDLGYVTKHMPTAANGGLGKVSPGKKGVPYLFVWSGQLYMARNVGSNDGAGNYTVPVRGEVWRCNSTNSDNLCPIGEWTRIITGKESELNAGSKSISLLTVNRNQLYVGFDSDNGVQIFKYNAATTPHPNATGGTTLAGAGWYQAGTDGIGKGYKTIFSYATVNDGTDYYIYAIIGTGTTAVSVVREID